MMDFTCLTDWAKIEETEIVKEQEISEEKEEKFYLKRSHYDHDLWVTGMQRGSWYDKCHKDEAQEKLHTNVPNENSDEIHMEENGTWILDEENLHDDSQERSE